jgi:hypothetical protein
MPTPAIQTLITDAQQVLNLKSLSEIRATMAAALANANVGTPLNPNLTTQQLWDQFYLIVRQTPTDIESILVNQMMKFVFSPPAPGGVGGNHEVIYNNNGVLAGDPKFLWDDALNRLDIDGSATITGDLTVDTSTLKVDSTGNAVGIGSASPAANTLTVGASRYILCSDSQSKIGDNGIINGAATDGNTQIQYFGGKALFFNEGASNTKMTLNSTGLGVGGSPTAKISCAGYSSANQLADINIVRSSSGTAIQTGPNIVFTDGTSNNTVTIQNSQGRFGIWNYGAGAWNERLSIDSSGNVGIGVTPSAWVSGSPAVQLKYNSSIWAFTDNSIQVNQNAFYDGAWKYINAASLEATNYYQNSGKHIWRSAIAGTAGNTIPWTTPMTLDASGNLLVGKTASSTSVVGSQIQPDGTFSAVKSDTNPAFFYNRSTAASGTIALFRSNSVTVGSITQDGTNTSYVTSSDYRLKEAVQPLVGGLARVSALKPSIYKWKSSGSSGEGFIAHELAEVVPAAVTGEKDAVNEDGTVNPQGVDLSKIVPILVAAIQELTARVQTLEAR